MTAPLELSVVTGFDEVVDLRVAWNDAFEASIDPNLFLSWEWISTRWRHFGAGAELHVLVVREGAAIVGIAPLARWNLRRGPLRCTVVRPIGHDARDYGGTLLVRREEEVVNLLVEHLEAEIRNRAAIVIWPRLVSASRFLTLARRLFANNPSLAVSLEELKGACPFTDVTTKFDLARTAKKQDIPRHARRLSDGGAVEFVNYSGLDIDRGFAQLQELHARRWEGGTANFPTTLNDAESAFLLDAVRAMDKRGWVRLTTLTAGGRPVAAMLGFEFDGRMYLRKAGFDPEFSRFGPGQLMVHRMFEDGMANGVTVFDFMRGDEPYKRFWANGEHALVNLVITRAGLLGRLDLARFRALRKLQVRAQGRTPAPQPRPVS